MEIKERIVLLFEQGFLCNCIQAPSWDRLYDENDRFIGYELAHYENCFGRVTAGLTLKELDKDEQV